MNTGLPRWVDVGLVPALNLLLALIVAGLVVLLIGEDPLQAVRVLLQGSLGSSYAIGFTLFYATTFVFTGLAVAVAFHAGLFNIGGEGQAILGGIGIALTALTLDGTHWLVTLPVAVLAAALFGAAWAAIPGVLQATRGSHVVITTIMFNFMASALLVYLLVDVLRVPGSMSPETRRFGEGAELPPMHVLLGYIGIPMARTPMNITSFLALLTSAGTWLLIWRTRLGYELRAFGHSEPAAVYAGISPVRIIVVVMLISGALAGCMALNVVLGYQSRLVLEFTAGAGFVGIAVALMGRSHPVGVVLAAVLFGMLYQGGAELAFEMPGISRDMIVVIQALVILFTGALERMVRAPVERIFLHRSAGTA